MQLGFYCFLAGNYGCLLTASYIYIQIYTLHYTGKSNLEHMQITLCDICFVILESVWVRGHPDSERGGLRQMGGGRERERELELENFIFYKDWRERGGKRGGGADRERDRELRRETERGRKGERKREGAREGTRERERTRKFYFTRERERERERLYEATCNCAVSLGTPESSAIQKLSIIFIIII